MKILKALAVTSLCLAPLAACSDDTPSAPSTTELTASPSLTSTSNPFQPSPTSATKKFDIGVTNGKAVGGLQELKAKKGEKVTITVSTADTTSEVHVHGYDLKGDLAPGKPAIITLEATIQGVFEIELEDTSTKIADLTVN